MVKKPKNGQFGGSKNEPWIETVTEIWGAIKCPKCEWVIHTPLQQRCHFCFTVFDWTVED